MGDELETLQALEESGSERLGTLHTVVAWLHQEGFHQAETALLVEVENRYPDQHNSRETESFLEQEQPYQSSTHGSLPREDVIVDLGATSSMLEAPCRADAPSSAERCAFPASTSFKMISSRLDLILIFFLAFSICRVVEAWRSKSTTPAASPRHTGSPILPPLPTMTSSGGGSGLGLGLGGASTSSARSPSQSTDVDEYDDDDDAGYWRVAATHQELYQPGGLQFPPETADAAAAAAAGAAGRSGVPYDSQNRTLGITKSPSSCSLPYSHSRQSSLELPLPLEAPVVGDFQRLSGLPPLPGSARSFGAAGFGGSSGSLGFNGQSSGISANNSPAPPPVVSAGLSGLGSGGNGSTNGNGGGNGFVTGAWPLQHQNSSGNRSQSSYDLEPYERSPPGAEGNAQQPLNKDTERWVFDRQNSAGSDAYKSLLNFLDQQSPRTLPLPLGSTGTTEAEAGTTGPSPRTPTEEPGVGSGGGGGGTCCEKPRPTGNAAAPPAARGVDKRSAVPDIDTARHMEEKQQLEQPEQQQQQQQQPPWQEPSAAELVDREGDAGGQKSDGNLVPVSSLSESVMQEVILETLQEIKLNEAEAVASPFAESRHRGSTGVRDAAASASTAAVGGAAVPEIEFDISSRDTPRTDEEEEGEEGIQPREEQEQQNQQQRSTLRSVKTAAARGGSPHGSTIATAGGGSPTPGGGKGDLFSFPVTSPSERGGDRAGARLGGVFASWPSFKNSGSPARSAGDGGYCSNEEEMTPKRKFNRRGHRPRLSAASSTGNFDGIPLPPAAPTHLALKFPQNVRRSRSQQGLATIVSSPLSSGQYSELALYEYNDRAFDEKYDVFDLKIIHRRGATGFEATREIPLRINDLIGGRYQIVDLLGQAAFCRAVQALDLKTGALVCLKVVKNNKDYVDQSLDEIKVLRYVNNADPGDEQGILRLYDYFYFKEHLILVTELLRANLYEFTKYNRESAAALYFTMPRIQSIAWQVLRSLAFLHSLNLIHADLKPENVLMKSYSACEVKVIDLGSSCFVTDRLSSYVQSRSYRAPEVMLGLPYGQKIDVWSLGCILAELATGKVLFHNSTPPAILARIEGILGPIPQNMVLKGKYSPKFFTSDGRIFEKNSQTGQIEFLRPKRTSLAKRVGDADAGLLNFITCLLQVDPARRPSAVEALQHPWLYQRY